MGETLSKGAVSQEIIVYDILQDEFKVKKSALIVFNPIDMERYVCEAPECFERRKSEIFTTRSLLGLQQ